MSRNRILRSERRADELLPPLLPPKRRRREINLEEGSRNRSPGPVRLDQQFAAGNVEQISPNRNGASRRVRSLSPVARRWDGNRDNQSLPPARLHGMSIRTLTSSATARDAAMEAVRKRAEVRMKRVEEQARIERELIEEQYRIEMADLHSQLGDDRSFVTRSEARVSDWLNQIPNPINEYQQRREDTESARRINETNGRAPSPGGMRATGNTTESGIEKLTNVLTQAVEKFGDSSAATKSSRNWLPEREFMLFYGNPLEWNMFKKAFETSMSRGQFTEDENILRLYKCLRGDAREAVMSLMTDCSQVNEVMEVLELRFGNPNIIAQSIAQEIRRLPPVDDRRSNIVTFATKIRNCVAAVRTAKHKGILYNSELVEQIIRKMPAVLVPHYHRFLYERKNEGEPVLVTLSNFLFREAEMACMAQSTYFSATTSSRNADRFQTGGQRTNERSRFRVSADEVLAAESEPGEVRQIPQKEMAARKCDFCSKDGHSLGYCRQLAQTPVKRRWTWVMNQRRCFQCLEKNHARKDCKAKPCGKNGCTRFHHKLLHSDDKKETECEVGNPGRSTAAQEPKEQVSLSAIAEGRILLKVLPVTIIGSKGSRVVNALLDEGSTVSLLNEELANELGLTGAVEEISIRGVMGTVTTVKSKTVNAIVEGSNGVRHGMKTIKTIPGFTVGSSFIKGNELGRFQHLVNLPIFTLGEAPKFLIGQDNWELIVTRELRAGDRKSPVASLTNLGWVVHGYIGQGMTTSAQCNLAWLSHKADVERRDDEILEMVKNSFKLDSLGITSHARQPKLEKRAEEILKKTTRRVGEGWEAGLLWREDEVSFPASHDVALKRLKNLEQKFKRDEGLKQLYRGEIKKLLDADYAEKAETNRIEEEAKIWYLPHFGVINPNKPGRVRVVFDAASEVEGKSLNNQLLSGPDLLQSLFGVLLRFRQGMIAFSGDIQDMFLRITIRPEDRNSQRFLWRENELDERPSVYVMKSLIFGAASSPCTAIYVKNLNAKEFASLHPKAVEAIEKKHYMDDYLDSTDSMEEARRLVEEVSMIHKHGGFRIRKWVTNKPEVFVNIPKSELDERAGKESTVRVLGVEWNTVRDTLAVDDKRVHGPSKNPKPGQRPTRRTVLKEVMSIYDPIGLLAPVLVQGRMLLQRTCRSGIAWDDQLEDAEYEKWTAWKEGLPHLITQSIPRCYFSKKGKRNIELHVFADASEEAYAAVCYLKTINEDGSIEVAFVAGKAQVAPVKPMTIPRLELQAALIASRLANSVGNELEMNLQRRCYWTDSSIVLSWIKNDPKRYNTFVANRLGEIDERTNARDWHWIPSEDNVADDATRWKDWTEHDDRWIKGSRVLFLPESNWPKMTVVEKPDNQVEVLTSLLVTIRSNPVRDILPDVGRFSSWLRLVRTVARVLQAVKYFKMKRRERRNLKKGLDVSLIRRATDMLVIQCQEESFAEEKACLEQDIPLSKKSRLLQYSPVLSKTKILKAEGRISRANVPESMRRPIILDGFVKYTKLLILHYHQVYGHGNTETVVNELRQHYVILGLRRAIKNVIGQCQVCKIRKSQPEVPRMGDLPAVRLEHHVRPFTNCGVDYFGPMLVKVGRRREKRWGVIFTCLSTRAIHLELASSLTTDSTIMAVRRMIARRGIPAVMISDNGTNLRGADVELKKAVEELDEAALETVALNRGFEWRFIPPAAPHMGGSWERLIRSVKASLKVVLKERVPSEETLTTLLAEVENIVNSRPLTHVSPDHVDEPSLTPNHFLIGSSGGGPPGKFDDSDLCLKRQWRVAQRLADQFWNRWVREFLPELIPRTTWRSEKPNLEVGDIVQIVDQNLPRNVWLKGRIKEVVPGSDGRVRSAKVDVAGGNTLVRPVSKLAVLTKGAVE